MPMIAVYPEAVPSRFRLGNSWKINLFGKKSNKVGPDIQAFRLDFDAGSGLDAHFHAVDQFQLFIAGGGKIGKHSVAHVMAHYADHHTPYGPIVAGDEGISYLTLRSKTDSGMVSLAHPGFRDQREPSRRRHRNSSPIEVSSAEALRARSDPSLESVIEHREGDDGLDVIVVRLGPNQSVIAPTAQGSGGQYHIVLNGSLRAEAKDLGAYSLVFVAPHESAPTIAAGEDGLELLITQFPAHDPWMASLPAA